MTTSSKFVAIRRFAQRNIWAALLAVAACVVMSPSTASAQLARVGPVDRSYGYPQWYQDTTGLTLEFCNNLTQAELNGGWCVLLPPDLPGGAPEVFPNNFTDEHFYMISNAGDRRVPVPGSANTVVATFVGALEGAFAAGPVRAGDQMVFARVRMLLNPVPFDGDYTFYTPMGKFTFAEQTAGDKIFFTEDIGLTPGSFTEALNGRIGPFLLPSAVPGGPEQPPVSADNQAPDQDPAHFGGVFAPTPYPGNGRKYIADPGRVGPITGGKTGTGAALYTVADGTTRDPNIFRIEGPNGFVYETTDFSLGGRIFEGAIAGDLKVNRASYARTSAGQIDVDVYATGSPATQGRIPAGPAPSVVATQMSYFDAPCTPTLDANGNPGVPYSAPASGSSHQMFEDRATYYGHSQPTSLPLEVCLQANAVNAAGQSSSTYVPAQLGDQVFISDARYDRNTQTLSVSARSSDALAAAKPTLTVQGYGVIGAGNTLVVNPVLSAPDKVVILSSNRGSNIRQVFPGTAAGTVTLPVANNDTASATEDTVVASINVLSNDSVSAGPGTVTIAAQGVLGTATVNADQSISYAPKLNAFGDDTFTYRVTDASGNVSNVASVTVTLAPVNDAPSANNDSAGALAGSPTSLNVLTNDTDPDGLGDLASAVIAVGNPSLGVVAGTEFANGIVAINPAAGLVGGNYTFTYFAKDRSGALSGATGTVTIAVSSLETITPAKTQFTSKSFRWVITGTVTPNSSQTMRITYLDGTYKPAGGSCAAPAQAAGFVVASPVVDPTNTYTFDSILSNTTGLMNPTNTGGNSNGFWCSPPRTMRITDTQSGIFTAPQAIAFK